jgi:hypothetical protein
MKKYLFTDVDDVTDEVIDIKGEEYAKLIDRLFQYGKIFSLQVPSHRMDYIDEIKRFAVTPKLNADKIWTFETDDGSYDMHDSYQNYNNKFFLCNDITKDFLINKIGCIFEYIWPNDNFNKDVPMDLEVFRDYPFTYPFIRSDPSYLYFSTTHEGYAILTINDDENFSDLLSENWKQVDIDFFPCWG